MQIIRHVSGKSSKDSITLIVAGFYDLTKGYLMLLEIQDPGLPHLFPSPDWSVMVQTLTLLLVPKSMVMDQRDEEK